MNWFRGLSRLWLAVSLPWIAAVGYLHADTVRTAISHLTESETVVIDETACQKAASPDERAICDLKRKLKRQTQITRTRARQDLTGAAQWILGPPVAVALLMMAVAWVVRGFRSD